MFDFYSRQCPCRFSSVPCERRVMRRLIVVFDLALLLGAAAMPACKDSGTTFTFDAGSDSGSSGDGPKGDGGGGDGSGDKGSTTPDTATADATAPDAPASDGAAPDRATSEAAT